VEWHHSHAFLFRRIPHSHAFLPIIQTHSYQSCLCLSTLRLGGLRLGALAVTSCHLTPELSGVRAGQARGLLPDKPSTSRAPAASLLPPYYICSTSSEEVDNRRREGGWGEGWGRREGGGRQGGETGRGVGETEGGVDSLEVFDLCKVDLEWVCRSGSCCDCH